MTDPEVRLGEIRAYLPAAKAGRAANPERYPADFDWAIGIVEELLLAVDRLQANNRMWMQQVNQLKDRLRELEWSGEGPHWKDEDGPPMCPACQAVESDGHDPECWLWLAIREA